jgi:hypothetical protein
MPYKDPEKGRICRKLLHENNRERDNARSKHYSRTHRNEIRARMMKKKYGLTPEAYGSLFLGQNKKCISCGTTNWGPDGPCVDHDHSTGKVRGILCHDCNMSEGLLKDPARAQALANYMRRNKE